MLQVIRRGISCNANNPRRFLTVSSVDGPLHPPLVSHTLPEYFRDVILKQNASRPALICRNENPGIHGGPHVGAESHLVWDFEEFDRNINALARGLLNLGVVKGDRIGVIMGNNRYTTSFSKKE
jgi:hypothetical protein